MISSQQREEEDEVEHTGLRNDEYDVAGPFDLLCILNDATSLKER